jgi:signal transduction histidine kinase
LLGAWRAFQQQLRLNELKSDFVASVSHELRAPIASVRLMGESLESGKVPEPQKQREYFGFIVQECLRLSALIENVLDFSRIEQGRKEYEREPTDLRALVRETVRLLEPGAAEKGVQIALAGAEASATPTNLELAVDGRAIQQALINLIDNAIKHSPAGAVVTVGLDLPPTGIADIGSAASGRRPAAGHLALWVEDHGPGIPPSEQEKIFERFYRLGSELRRETQGVGIGLSIVKHVIEAHGGRVTVRSVMGQGSRFTLELPLNTKNGRLAS